MGTETLHGGNSVSEPALCWIPKCSANVVYTVVSSGYSGGIIGFCQVHKPILRVEVFTDMELVNE